jgi:general secretion pathway protein K
MTRLLHGSGAPRRGERGAALLVVMVAVAILTALAVDLAYETRVRLQIAANGRDELRASALARSGVNLSRLILTFQQQIDEAVGNTCGAVAKAAGAAAGGQGAAIPCPRPQLWSLVPVSSGLAGALFEGGAAAAPSGPSEEAGAREGTARAPAGADGGFEAKIEDEGTKVNVQLENPNAGTAALQVEALLRTVCDPRWDPLFDREDRDGQRYTRADLLAHLRDWADDDANASVAAVSWPGGGGCSFVVSPTPFEQGFSDENYPYDRGRDRYRAKNARLDSLEELHLVAGVSDLFMAAFGDQLTVYQPRNPKLNVNAPDRPARLRIAWIMAEPAARPLLEDPLFPDRLDQALAEATYGGLVSISPSQLAIVLQSLGIAVRPQFVTPGPTNLFTDRSSTYRIRAVGAAGDVTRTIDAVVTFDPAQNQNPTQNPNTVPGQPAVGQLIRWREE